MRRRSGGVGWWLLAVIVGGLWGCSAPPAPKARAAISPAPAFTALVAFGDSLTDNGNRGIDTNKNSLVYPRETWVHQLARPALLNIPGLRASGRKEFSGGSNYAYGGATTEYVASLKLGDAQARNLTNQISGRYLNPAFNPAGVDPDALHVVQIGGNDLVFAAASRRQMLTGWLTLDGVARKSARSAEQQIQALATAGVENVLWFSLIDPARIPAVHYHAQKAGVLRGRLVRALSGAARAFNREMEDAIVRLEAANPNLTLIRLDVNRMFDEFENEAARNGIVTLTAGANDDEHVFSADGLHPTTHGHFLIAQHVYRLLSERRK